MGQRKDIDGSTGVPTFYGGELRWKREEAGLTLLVAGRAASHLPRRIFMSTYSAMITAAKHAMNISASRPFSTGEYVPLAVKPGESVNSDLL